MSDGRPSLDERITKLPAVSNVIQEIESPFVGDPLRRRGWLWRGEPLDLFALVVVILGMQTSLDFIAGDSRTPLHTLVRASPILFVAVIVAVLTWFHPESLRARKRGRS
jgi:hypothetical protein